MAMQGETNCIDARLHLTGIEIDDQVESPRHCTAGGGIASPSMPATVHIAQVTWLSCLENLRVRTALAMACWFNIVCQFSPNGRADAADAACHVRTGALAAIE